MLEVKIELAHEGEVALFAEFTQILRRNRQIENGTATPEDTQPRPADAPSTETPAIEAEYEVVGSIGPNGRVTKKESDEDEIAATIQPETDPITDGALIEAFQKFAASKPMPVLIALLAEFGAKKVGEIAQEKRAAFLEAVKA